MLQKAVLTATRSGRIIDYLIGLQYRAFHPQNRKIGLLSRQQTLLSTATLSVVVTKHASPQATDYNFNSA